MRRLRLLSVFSLSCLFAMAAVAGATNVSGTITTTTWTKAQSPYSVTASITVPSGSILTIEPGVQVLFAGTTTLDVQGALRAVGTEAERITFTAGGTASWGGVRITGGDTSAICFANFSFAYRYGSGGALYVGGAGTRLGLVSSDVSWNEVDGDGGGICVDEGASATIVSSTISDNIAAYGGGVSVTNGATLSMTHSTVSYNAADQDGGGLFLALGAIVGLNSTTVTNNGTFYYYGGGIEAWNNVSLTMTDCVVTENVAADDGGGLDLSSGATATLARCQITWNDGYYGGGVWTDSAFTATDCLISDNLGLAEGGGMAVFDGPATLTNCTLADNCVGTAVNETPASGGLYVTAENQSTQALSLVNGVVWRNSPGGVCNDATAPATLAITYSDIQMTDTQAHAGTGNINGDPIFSAPNSDDYTLGTGSPCIDAGDPASPLDEDNSRADMGALRALTPVSVEREQTAPTALSLEQNVPNPFNPVTSIPFTIRTAGHVVMTIHTISGQQIAVVADDTFTSGAHEIVWNGRDALGRPVGSGIYLYRIISPDGILARKMTLVR